MTELSGKFNLKNLKVGDPVRVFDLNGSRVGQPPGGWEGTVTKKGTKLVTVAYEMKT